MNLNRVASTILLLALAASPVGAWASDCPYFELAGRTIMGLVWEPGALWATHYDGLDSDHVVISKLDPTTGEVLDELQLDHNGRCIGVGLGSLWVVDALNDQVHRLDPLTFAETAVFPTPGTEPSGITFDGHYLWLTDPYAQRIYQLSPSGSVLGSFPIPDAARLGLEWDARGDGVLWTPIGDYEIGCYSTDGLLTGSYTLDCVAGGVRILDVAISPACWFVSSGSRIYRVMDPTCTYFELAGRAVMGLAWEPDALWATHFDSLDTDHVVISKLDPATGEVLAETQRNYNGRGICVGLGSLWVVDALHDQVHRLDPVTLAETAVFSTPGTEPCGITCDGTNLWLTDPWRQKIDKLSPTGTVICSVPIPDAARTGLEWDARGGGGLWTPIADQTLGRYTPCPGDLVETCVIECVMGRIFDLAIASDSWFVSSGSRIYRVADPSAFAAPACDSILLAGRKLVGLDFEEDTLWVIHHYGDDSDHVVISKLDPATGEVLAEAQRNYNGRGICVGLGSLWVVDALHDQVHQLDPMTLAETAAFPTPGTEPCGITCDGTNLWLSDPSFQRIYNLSPTGTVISEFSIPDVARTGLEWDARRDGGLWTPIADQVVGRYTTAGALTLVPTIACARERIMDLAIAPDCWFVSSGSRIYKVEGFGDPFTDVADLPVAMGSLSLYPNPFNPRTTIAFDLPTDSDISLVVHDLRGRVVQTIASGVYSRGRHEFAWNGTDDSGRSVPTGVYFCRLLTPTSRQVGKMVLMK